LGGEAFLAEKPNQNCKNTREGNKKTVQNSGAGAIGRKKGGNDLDRLQLSQLGNERSAKLTPSEHNTPEEFQDRGVNSTAYGGVVKSRGGRISTEKPEIRYNMRRKDYGDLTEKMRKSEKPHHNGAQRRNLIEAKKGLQ